MRTKWQGPGLYDVFCKGEDDEGCARYTYQWTRYYPGDGEFMATHIYLRTTKGKRRKK
jgi:hypothetical protein